MPTGDVSLSACNLMRARAFEITESILSNIETHDDFFIYYF